MENIDEIVSYTSKKPIFDLNFRGKPVIFRGTRHGPQILIGRRADVEKFVKRAGGYLQDFDATGRRVSKLKTIDDYQISDVVVTGTPYSRTGLVKLGVKHAKEAAEYFNEDGKSLALLSVKPGPQHGTVALSILHKGSIEDALSKFKNMSGTSLNLKIVD